MHLLHIGVDFVQQRLVFLGNQRTEQIDNLLRTVHICLEIAQIGVAVAVFLAADFAAGHFFNQHGRAAHHFAGREVQHVDFRFQFFHVGFQTVGNGTHIVHRFFNPQRVFQAVEAGEQFVFRAVFEIVFARIDGRVEFVKQFGNRLDTLVMRTHVGEHGFGLVLFAGFYCRHKFVGFANQFRSFRLNVFFVCRQRLGQFQHIRLTACGFKAAVGHSQFAVRVVQKAAGHGVFARQQRYRHFVAQAGGDVFTFVHHHHAVQNFPFQFTRAVVLDLEFHLSARHGQFHRFAGFVVHGDLHGSACRRARCCGCTRCHTGSRCFRRGRFVCSGRLAGGQRQQC